MRVPITCGLMGITTLKRTGFKAWHGWPKHHEYDFVA